MKRSRRVALAALCVLALAIGAATLNDTTAPRGGGLPGETNGSSFDPFPDNDLHNDTRNPDFGGLGGLSSIGHCIEFLTSGTFYALAFLGFLALGAVLYRKGGVLLAVAGIGVLSTPGFVLWALLTTCSFPETEGKSEDPGLSGGDGGLLGGESGGVVPVAGSPDISHAVLLVTALVILLVAFFMLKATGDDREADKHADEAEDVPTESLAGIATVASEAADRIESGDVDTENEVYRAWREMTAFLDVPNPESATPAEFREAAREAGMTAPDVAVLTDLFREVRYGGESPTEDREAAAVDALRAIEDAYGERGDDDA